VGVKGRDMKAAIINSKGFGGNNASALILSPQTSMEMLENKHGSEKIAHYKRLNEKVRAAAAAYDKAMINGDIKVIYHFGSDVMTADDLTISKTGIKLSKFDNELAFEQGNPFSDYS
jgi:acetoacetyl-[acyl-carrier protein] synthase